ncbi:MAG TPA: adenylate/guanylate cyclase domain-containing protein [Gaiellaceae bacterium]|nr:adenylate/guanylate cyclase domain-containing protein [Gaiellaceae bacterium]
MVDSRLPRGTVTFLFTDIEGSTRLIDEVGEDGYVQVLAEHRRLLRSAFSAHGGVEVDTQGDAFLYAFAAPVDALAAAAEGQQALAAGPVKVRMGLHTGEPRLTGEGYAGRELHRAARIAAAGHGGQIVVSAATRALVDGDLTALGEHRLKDFVEPVALFQLGQEPFPPLKTISNTNLPRPASSFVGRQRERDELVSMLSNGTRLVTLSGPGGSGKTRLGIEAAAELVPAFNAGVFWIGLAPLRDPALVTEAIAQTLGAKDGLAEHVAERELLLLLDNFEQVVEAAPQLGELLERCPQLKLLVTSRELLRIRGEVEYPVPPLAEPEAVELFCARSQLEPDETIAELCRRLDDLPLALELAAARTRILSPAQILERLSQRLDLLEGGRDAEPRQRTLRATIAWSHDLLDDREQTLFARLAVFRGGCTLEAAEEVADADLNALQSLVEKSLLRHTNERFWMLETIREYARERLAQSGAEGEAGRRHAEYFLALAEQARGPDTRDYTRDYSGPVEAEHDNLRRALEWARDLDEGESLLRLAAALGDYWGTRGFNREARVWLALALERGSGPVEARKVVLWQAIGLALDQGDLARAEVLVEELRRLAEETGDERRLSFTVSSSAVLAVKQGDLVSARAGFARARELATEHGWHLRAASMTVSLAAVSSASGDFRAGLDYSLDAVKRFRQLGSVRGVPIALISCGWSAHGLGDHTRAEDSYREAISLAGELSAVPWIAEAAFGLGLVFIARHEEERGTQLLAAAAALRDELETTLNDEQEQEMHEAAIAAAEAALGEEAFAAAWARGHAMRAEEIVAFSEAN